MNANRWIILGLGAILVVFGAACLNYTKPSAVEHHRNWAAEHDAPPPSDTVMLGGVTAVAAGAGLLALGFSRRRTG